MKKINVVTLASLLLFGFNNLMAQDAQTNKKEVSENCVSKGRFIIDAYYGYPYVVGKYIKTIVSGSGAGNIDVTNLNHLGGKFEYMLNDMIGLGFEYTFASVTAKYVETRSVYNNSTNQYDNQTESYTLGINKQRMLAKINIHFATSKYLDPYATGGIGYKNTNVYSSNINDQQGVAEASRALNILPVAFRLGIGMRYYFIKNLGVGVEAGIGGPLIQAGISGKF
ncbi:MAG: outer membrane beta-barrel protein [Bacteroidota bacterium]